MATAKLFRDTVLACAADAIKDVPDNTDFRARCFIASLTGALSAVGEEALAAALRQVSARGTAGEQAGRAACVPAGQPAMVTP